MPGPSNTAFPGWRRTFKTLLTPSAPGISAGFSVPSTGTLGRQQKGGAHSAGTMAGFTSCLHPKKSQIFNNSALFKNQKRTVWQRSRLQPNTPLYCVQTLWYFSTSPVDPTWICNSEIPTHFLGNPLTQAMAFFKIKSPQTSLAFSDCTRK